MRTATDLVVVKSKSLSKTHVLDRRYAVLGKALCGAGVNTTERPGKALGAVDCKKCKEMV